MTVLRRTRVRVEGTVQGVGFRPFVYRLADELGLAGYVLNDAHGVLLEVEGDDRLIDEFLARLSSDAPPLAVIERLVTGDCRPDGGQEFTIRPSPAAFAGEADAPITPDTAICADCLRELLDPADRRHRYPFINCTNCGPRFTILRGVPYDRPLTTMAGFTMCEACRTEYEDPSDRRFHAQPNACPVCGPSVSLWRPGAVKVAATPSRDPLKEAAQALRGGAILAVKGIGGYHLACLAADEQVVARLRSRKHREDKPFALMAASVEQARRLVELGPDQLELLSSAQRPIVLAPRLPDAPVAPSVAPASPELGVMLPYSPLHHLLVGDVGETLVLTSGNVSDEPIAFEDADAQERLAAIADLFLLHDRPIQTRTDDSVMRVLAGRRMFLRRSRGYVPAGINLPGGTRRPLLACGAELKNTFCLAKGARAWVGHHIGDLHNYETLRSFTEGVAHFEEVFDVRPEVVAHDLHPEYLSTKYALERDGVELMDVQHHHAHLAACLAEHGLAPGERAVGAIFDGTGYGTDGTVWGGEILCGDLRDFERVGSLRPVRMPGGEAAIREPWRMACAWLVAAGAGEQVPAGLRGTVDSESWAQVRRLVDSGVASPVTTSIGRLFDAVAAICGIRARVNYEGQAAIELEAACAAGGGPYPVVVSDMLEIDPREALLAIARDIGAGVPAGAVAARFHAGIAAATVEACARAASARGLSKVVLSGGVFQNRRLLSGVAATLSDAGLRVLAPSLLPPGDGGISYGQAAVAAARIDG